MEENYNNPENYDMKAQEFIQIIIINNGDEINNVNNNNNIQVIVNYKKEDLHLRIL